MEEKPERCPYCGSGELTQYKQTGYGQIFPKKRLLRVGGQSLIHILCRQCGSVVRSYVEHPETLE